MEGEGHNVLSLKSLLKCFELVSGFTINWTKNQLLGLGLTASDCSHMASLVGYSSKDWPTEYSGFSLG